MSSTTMRSARQMRVTTRWTEASTLARPTVAVRDSSENQATRMPWSMTAAPSASQMGLAGAAGSRDSRVLVAAHPFQGAVDLVSQHGVDTVRDQEAQAFDRLRTHSGHHLLQGRQARQ